MRLLVTGAGGQLGLDLVEFARLAGDDVIAADRTVLDVGDRDAVVRVVGEVRPDVIVNSAAWTAVDACESDPERAMRDNGEAVRWLREASDDVGAHLVQISTDYVFDGRLDRPYVESDATNPQSVYGRSKLAGEHAAGDAATVVRTSWVCGYGGGTTVKGSAVKGNTVKGNTVKGNMVKTVLHISEGGGPLSFVDDQRGCPTFTADLAPLVHRLATERRAGTFHATNQGAVSWYEFARDIVAAAGRDPGMVHPIATVDLDPPRPAPRPANSVLENAALRDAGIPLLRDFHAPLGELVARLLS